MGKGILDNINRKSGMKTPDGYFESLHDRVMLNLPKKEIIVEEPARIPFWTMVKPWVYMAAMFAGIALMFKVFTLTNDSIQDYSADNKIKESEQEVVEDFIFYNNVSDYALFEFIADGN